MGNLVYKPIALIGIFAISLFGCAGSTDRVETEAQDLEEKETLFDNEPLTSKDIEYYEDMFDEVETENLDILSLTRGEEELSTFVELVELSGMEASLMIAGSEQQPITVFIPTNKAFQNLTKEQNQFLKNPANKAVLAKLILAHVLPSKVPAAEFSSMHKIKTAGDQTIPVEAEMHGTLVRIGRNATIVKNDIPASNGLIHVVDGVIIPDNSEDLGLGTY